MNGKLVVPEAKQAMENLKNEVAQSMGVNLNGYSGNITSRQAGSVGGEMVKRMIKDYENGKKQ